MDARVGSLLSALTDPSIEARRRAASMLANVGSLEAIDPLTSSLDDPDADVRLNAARSLGALGSKKPLHRLMERLDEESSGLVQTAILEALARIGGKAVRRRLTGILLDPASTLHVRLIKALGNSRSASAYADEIEELLDMPGYPWQAEVLELVTMLPAARAEKLLLKTLLSQANTGPAVRAAAARALKNYPSTRNWTELASLLTDQHQEVRLAVIEALGAFNPRRLLDEAADLLLTGGSREKTLLLSLTAEHGTDEHASTVLALLRSESDAPVLEAAIRALIRLGVPSPSVLGGLEGLAGHPSPRVRAALAELMGRPGVAGSLDFFKNLLTDNHRGVRRAVARALGRMEDDRAIGLLQTMLEDRSADVRIHVIRSLCATGSDGLKRTLLDRLSDPSPKVRAEILSQLENFEFEGVEPELVTAATDIDEKVRRRAARLLRRLGGHIPEEASVSRGRKLLEEENRQKAREVFGAVLDRDPGSAEAHLELAGIALSDGDRNIARSHIIRGLESRPDHGGLLAAAADLARLEGKTETEISFIERLLKTSSSNWKLRRRLGLLLVEQGRHRDALEHLEIVLEKRFSDTEVHLALGKAFAATGDLITARREFEHVLEHDPFDTTAQAALASLLVEEGEHDRALELYRRVIGLMPERLDLLEEMARAAYRAGDLEMALEAWSELVKKDPSRHSAHIPVAEIELKNGRFQRALSHVDRYLEHEPKDIEALLLKADILEARGQFHQAIDLCFVIHAINPETTNLLLRIGRLFESCGQKQQAIECYRDHLKSNPLDIETGLLLAREDEKQRDFSQAIKKLIRCMKVKPDDARPPMELARIYRELGDNVQALKFADRAIELSPDDLDCRLLRVELCFELDALDKARSELHKILEVNDDNPQAHRLLGNLYYRDGAFTRALYHLNQLPMSWADDPSYCRELGGSYKALGHFERAGEWLDTARRLDPTDTGILASLAELELVKGENGRALGFARELLSIDAAHPDGYRLCGLALARRGADEEAEEALVKALVARPDNAEIRETLAVVRFRLNKYQSSMDLYPELNLVPTNCPWTRMLKARCHLAMGNRERAEIIIEEALSQSPFDTEALELKADVCIAAQDMHSAERVLNAAIRTDPTRASLLRRRGLVLLERKCYDRARLSLLAAIERDPQDEQALALLGRLELEAQRPRQALEHLSRLVTIKPSWPKGHELRAQAFTILDDNESALESLRNVCQLSPDDAASRLELGTQLLRQGNTEEARIHLEEYLELSDDRSPALEALADLHQEEGNLTEARFYLREMLKVQDKPRKVLVRLAELLFTSHKSDEAWRLLEETKLNEPGLTAELGQRALKHGNLTLARDLLRSAISRNPVDHQSMLALAECHYLRGESSLARSAIEKLLAGNEYPKAHYRFGLILLLEDNNAGAIEAFRKAVEIDECLGEAWLRLADTLLDEKRAEEAVEAANGAISAGAPRTQSLTLLGRALVACGKNNEAIEVYRELSELSPNDENIFTLAGLLQKEERYAAVTSLLRDRAKDDTAPESLRLLYGHALYEQKEYAQAVEYLKLGETTKDPDSVRKLMQALVALERFEEAAVALRKLLELAPYDIEALLTAGELSERVHNHSAAERAYRLAAERHPGNVRARFKTAEIHFRTGRLREALSETRSVLKINPSLVEALVLQARIFEKLDMHEKARTTWETVYNLPEGRRPEFALELSRAYRRTGEEGRAARLLEELSNSDSAAAAALRERIELAFAASNWSETLRLYRTFRSRHPEEPGMPELVGMCYVKLGMTVRAAAELNKLIQMGLPCERLTTSLARRYLEERRHREAERVVRVSIEKEPASRNLWFLLAKIQLEMRVFNEAEASLLSLLRLKPQDQEAQITLGYVYEKTKQYEKMRATFLELVHDNPYSADSRLGLAKSELLTGLADKAKSSFEKAVQLDRSSQEAYMGLAEACRLTGDREGAINAYRSVLRLDGKNEKALFELGSTYQSVQKRELAVFHLERLLEVAPRDSQYIGLARNLLEENRRRLIN